VNGFLVNDAAEVADRVAVWLTNLGVGRDMADRGRDVARKDTWLRIADELNALGTKLGVGGTACAA
jgi:hypothetical protein